MTMANGMFLWGFLASSPVAATVSKPTKAQKQVAAPAITPEKPKGRKPPSPGFATDSGIDSFGIFQLLMSALE